MSRKEWEDKHILIGPPGSSDDQCLKVLMLGKKDENLNRAAKNAYKNGVNLLEDSKKVSEYTRLVIVPLSAELLLKSIIYSTTQKFPRGHDLYELFFMLNAEEQNEILYSYLTRNIAEDTVLDDIDAKVNEEVDSFEDLLSMNAMCFETLRYKHELSSYVHCIDFVFNLCVSLKQLGSKFGLG